jgi:hypothetical protein
VVGSSVLRPIEQEKKSHGLRTVYTSRIVF